MTVINPKSISGITSITLPSGGDNVLTIHTNDGIERFRIDSSGNVKVGSAATISPDGDVFFTGVCTATTLAGSGANLTSLPSAQLSGALPALDGSALTGVASTENIRTNTNATFLQNINVSGITTVGSAVTISESGIEASGIGITCANINGGQIGGRKNLIINGAMQVAQRGITYTGTNNHHTVDRILTSTGGLDENCTFAQVDVSSGTTPYTLGFRKAFKVTNGNQTSGAQSSDYVQIQYRIEAQDIANSGWNYTSTSSFITLQFWVKSSVAQNFYCFIRCKDGTAQLYRFDTGSLSANTWTKVVKTIPGNSNLTFDNNSGEGFQINISPYWGTDYTDSGVSLNAWGAYSSTSRAQDHTTTWYETNDATFEITGLQLEVGSQATEFEHRSYAEELALCQRYFYMHAFGSNFSSSAPADSSAVGTAVRYSQTSFFGPIFFPVQMRATPSFLKSTGTDHFILLKEGSNDSFNDIAVQDMGINSAIVNYYDGINNSSQAGWVQIENNYDGYIGFTAEL